jgi:hypothetical protein
LRGAPIVIADNLPKIPRSSSPFTNPTLCCGTTTSLDGKANNHELPHLQTRNASPGICKCNTRTQGAVLVFKDVPADICDNCGEVFHREDIARALLSQAEAALKQGVELDIRRFAQAA